MTRPIVATIDLNALRHNFGVVRKHAPNAKVWSVIKANAYGHGARPVATALERAGASCGARQGADEAWALAPTTSRQRRIAPQVAPALRVATG